MGNQHQGGNKMTINEIKRKINDLYGNVEYEIIEFSTMRNPFKIKCLKCGNIISMKYMSNFFKKTRRNFCPYCANTFKGDKIGKTLSLEEAQQRLDDVYPNEYKIVENRYKGWSKKGIILHSCGKYFECTPRDILYHSHCPCKKTISKGEEKVKQILSKFNIDYQEQKRLKEISKAPFDFYIPKYNLLIEFQGRQHYEPVEKFGGEKQLQKQKEIDKRKQEIALKNGYKLLYISYKQISEIEEILVQRLSLLGVGSSEPKEQALFKQR